MRAAYLPIAATAALVFAQPAAADTVSDWWDFGARLANAAQAAGGLAEASSPNASIDPAQASATPRPARSKPPATPSRRRAVIHEVATR